MEETRAKRERPERNADGEDKERKGETNGRRLKGGRVKEKKTRVLQEKRREEESRETVRRREEEREKRKILYF